MGIIWFFIGLFVFDSAVFGLALMVGARWAIRLGRKALGWARERNLPPGPSSTDEQMPQDPARPAKDVVVENVGEGSDDAASRGGAQAPRPDGSSAAGSRGAHGGMHGAGQASGSASADAGRTTGAGSSGGKRPRPPKGAPSSNEQQRDKTREAAGYSQQRATMHEAGEQAVSHHSYVRLDPDTGTTSGDISKVLRSYTQDPVMGPYAQGVIDVLASAELHHESLFIELDSTFQRGTISWDKFAGPSYAALDSLLRNSAYLANRIQSFDTNGYLRLERSMSRDVSEGSNGGTGARAERWKLYCEMIDSFDALQETNERLLLELDKLKAELVTLSASSTTEASDPIIEEISRLVEEAKLYR